jgi:carboxylesterase
MKRLLITILLLLVACTQQKIDMSIKPGNEGFMIGNGSIGVILSHGLGASPYEVKALAEYLAQRNMTVYAVRLDGHGTSKEDLQYRTWEDWYANIQQTYDVMKGTKEKIFVGGSSLGGVLMLKFVEDHDVDGIIAIAPALILDDGRSNYAWLFKYFTKYSSRVVSEERKPYYYSAFPVASVAELVELSKIVMRDLPKITEPVFLLQSKDDDRVKAKSSQLVYDAVSSEKKELVWVNGTDHVVILIDGKEQYYEKIYQFILQNS